MAEDGEAAAAPTAAKVRVVRCPKCQKLLPELAGFKFYRCGGCDTTLQAEHPALTTDTSSEKSDEERTRVPENSESCSGKKGIVSNMSSEADQDNNRIESRRNEEVRTVNSNGISTVRSENRQVSEESLLSGFNGMSMGSGMEYRDSRYRRPSKAPVEDYSPSVDGTVKPSDKDHKVNKLDGECSNRSRKVQNTPVYEDEKRDGVGALRRTPRALLEGNRFSPYSDEGLSNSQPSSTYSSRDADRIRNQNPDGPKRVENLEQDRAELLRKLDELRDQLSRSCDVTGQANEGIPMDRRAAHSNPYDRRGHGTWFPKDSSSLNGTSVRHFPLMNEQNVDAQRFYSPLHAQDDIAGYGEPFGSQPLRRATYQTPHQYPQRPLDNYIYGQFDPDPFIAYSHDIFYHQPACSCPHCCNKHWQMPAQAPPVFCNRRVPYVANNHGLYPVDDPYILNSASYDYRGSNGLLSREPQRSRRAVFPKQGGRGCQPIAGAAPFIVCYNCSELLQVPHNLLSSGNKRYKLRCGSCSQVISFKLDGKRLVVSSPSPAAHRTLEHRNDSGNATREGSSCQDAENLNFVHPYTEDYDSSCYNIQSTDEKLVLSSSPLPIPSQETMEKECGLNLSESENVQGLTSSPSSSEDVESPDSMVCQGEVRSSTELPLKAEANSRGPGLPLREHFGYPSSHQAVCRSGDISCSRREDKEKLVIISGNFKQSSVKEVSVATEMDLSGDEYMNPGFSQDSEEASKEEDQPRMSKGGESFFTGLIKKSFRDFPRFNQPLEIGKAKVSVNGRHIPDRLVKKVEKQAGHIHPGEYWYDHQAGFWGVMGHPCLGIIPPFIEEFNYPMPKNCAGGNTGVTVNGRELHQKDLDLLVGRGLPPYRDRSYIIDISGRVMDEVSGDELDSLGKLAPTVEKVKRGFGMRVPRGLTG